jgi:hypothetical protein
LTLVHSITVDASNVYWDELSTGKRSIASLKACAIGGCDAGRLVAGQGEGFEEGAVEAPMVSDGHDLFTMFSNKEVKDSIEIAQCPVAGCKTPKPFVKYLPGIEMNGFLLSGSELVWLATDGFQYDLAHCPVSGCPGKGNDPIKATTGTVPDDLQLVGPLVASGESVIWAAVGEILTCKLSSCAHPKVLTKTKDTPNAFLTVGLAVSSNEFYWIGSSTGTLHACPTTGCVAEPSDIAKDATAVVADARGVYFGTTKSGILHCTGECTKTDVVQSEGVPLAMALDSKNIYWTDAHKIWQLPRAD